MPADPGHVSDTPPPEPRPLRVEDVTFADSAASRRESTSLGGLPREAASFIVGPISNCNIGHHHPLLATTRGMANRVHMIGRDRYPLARIR